MILLEKCDFRIGIMRENWCEIETKKADVLQYIFPNSLLIFQKLYLGDF